MGFCALAPSEMARDDGALWKPAYQSQKVLSGEPAWLINPAMGLHVLRPQFPKMTTEGGRTCSRHPSSLSHILLSPSMPISHCGKSDRPRIPGGCHWPRSPLAP